MKQLCYVCGQTAVMNCRECNSKVCHAHYKFHGLKCIVYTDTILSRTDSKI